MSNAFDNFDRTVAAGGFGTAAPLARSWIQGVAGFNNNGLSVDGSDGVIDFSVADTSEALDLTAVTLPLEVLCRWTLAQSAFPPTTGTGRIDIAFYLRNALTGGNVISADLFQFSGIPNGGIGFGDVDDRTFTGTLDFDDGLALTDGGIVTKEWYTRFYVDDHGVYLRVWYVTDPEPIASLLFPYGGGTPGVSGGRTYGKAQSWNAYRVSDAARDPLPGGGLRYFVIETPKLTTGVNIAKLKQTCIISGIPESDGTCEAVFTILPNDPEEAVYGVIATAWST